MKSSDASASKKTALFSHLGFPNTDIRKMMMDVDEGGGHDDDGGNEVGEMKMATLVVVGLAAEAAAPKAAPQA